jgi:hypothetical protein
MWSVYSRAGGSDECPKVRQSMRRQGPEGRLPNVSPAREGWDINPHEPERCRRGTPLIQTHVWDRRIRPPFSAAPGTPLRMSFSGGVRASGCMWCLRCYGPREHNYWNRNGSNASRGFAKDSMHGAAPTALRIMMIDNPALSGWADVWRSALRALTTR